MPNSNPAREVEVSPKSVPSQPSGEDASARSGGDAHPPVLLKSGEALKLCEAFSITACSRTRVLMIAGAVESGKTTLIASLFHCFQQGAFAGYMFAGSDTLIAFDERCYLSRIASGRATPATQRTSPSVERNLLHLRVRKRNLGERPIDVLIVDISGEDYERARDSVEECGRFPLIKRADHFILLVDGERLVRPASRQSAKNDAMMLLRSCLDAGQLGMHSSVDVLISKWDLISAQSRPAESQEFVGHMEKHLNKQFGQRCGSLRFWRVAARPEKPGFSIGYGLSEPFVSWVENLSPGHSVVSSPADTLDVHTEFDRYLRRRLYKPSVEERA